MFSEREYMRDFRVVLPWPGTLGILALNLIVFGIQNLAETFFPLFPFDHYFALSLDGLKSGFIWQLLTYQFMHAGFFHIFFNSWAIYVFGHAVEEALGKRRMLFLYFLSGVAGGGLQMLGAWLLPSLMDDMPVVGASAGAFGLVAAFAALFPNEILYALLFFVIPIKLRASTLLWISVIIALVGIIFPYISSVVPAWSGVRLFFENIGHAAHLGGIIAGYVIARQIARRSRWAPSAHHLF
jgi:membrane associated rhomboid family serine protease